MMVSHSKELVAHKSIADLVTKGYLNIDSVTRKVGVCPYCEGELREYIEPEDTPPRCPPFCMHEEFIEDHRGRKKSYWTGCGYRAMKKREDKIVANKYQETLKADAIGFMKKNSIFTDDSTWGKSFDTYQELDPETITAKAKAMAFVSDLAKKDSNAHVFMSGNTGVGKTHLGASMVFEYLSQTGYKTTCMLISHRELLEQLKYAMSDNEVRKKVTGDVMREVKRVDLVLVDDVGANLGSFDFTKKIDKNNKPPSIPTSYDIDTLNSLFEARLEKPTIITTNLTSNHIKQLYGERLYSRMVNNVGNRFIKFEETTDKRVKGI